MADYFDQDFLLTAQGDGFVLTQSGKGNMDAAKAAFAAITGLPVHARFTGMTPEEREEMMSGR